VETPFLNSLVQAHSLSYLILQLVVAVVVKLQLVQQVHQTLAVLAVKV
jgi:hypothetical protein